MTISLREYTNVLANALHQVAEEELQRATDIIETAYNESKTIFIAGNGQSATTANAFALDLTKQTSPPPSKPRFRTISISSNAAAMTAWANDANYTVVFTEQLKSLFTAGDILLVVSASGNSPNILDAARWVQENDGKVVGMSGFAGGKLKELADACIVVPIDDYGHVETAHIAIMHYWVDLFREILNQ